MALASVPFSCGLDLNNALAQLVTQHYNEWMGTQWTVDEAARKCSAEDVAGALALMTDFPILRRPQDVADPDVFTRIDHALLRQGLGLPVAYQPSTNTVTIALANPYLPLLRERCEQVWPKCTVQVAVTPFDDLATWFQQNTSATSSSDIDLSEIEVTDEADAVPVFDLETPLEDPLRRKVQELFRKALELKASDVHFVVENDMFYVELRIDGIISYEEQLRYEVWRQFDAFLMGLAGEKIEHKRLPQDGRFNLVTSTARISVRYARSPLVNGCHVVCRLLDSGGVPHGVFEGGVELGSETVLWIQRMLEAPEGLFLVSGPTGSGKTTTLYSFLREVNKPEYNIITIEQPVEMLIRGIKQSMVNPKRPDEFSLYLRSGLRRDPDIFLVGEIRDRESAELAAQAANTGHLVLSTIHTKTAPGIFTRLEDFGLPKWKVADVLLGAAAQRLPRMLCPQCRVPTTGATEKEIKLYGLPRSWLNQPFFRHNPNGCPDCRHRGYRGRRAVLEVIPVTDELAYIAAEAKTTVRDIAHYAYHTLKVPSLRDLGLNMVKQGKTDLAAVAEVINMTMTTTTRDI